jgi:hypothetical protein
MTSFGCAALHHTFRETDATGEAPVARKGPSVSELERGAIHSASRHSSNVMFTMWNYLQC